MSKIAIHLSITNTAGLETNQIAVSIPSVHTQGDLISQLEN
ncbi:hypothetical protein [Sphingobacterium sp. E70]|nr:hypothetical protein [Sphingobacterium sp. E70]